MSKYAITHCIAKEFDTNATTKFPPCLDEECQTQLKTLKLGPCCISSYVTSSSSDCFAVFRNIDRNPMGGCFPSLTTLQLYKVEFDNYQNDMNLFSNFSSLENLLLIGCSMKLDNNLIFNISAPRMTSLTISDFDICYMMRLEISAPTLKLFNLKGNPLWLSMKNCHQALEEVKIDLFQPPEEDARKKILKEVRIFHLKRMIKGLCHTNSLRVSFTFSSKGKFLLYQNSHVIEVKFVDLKGTEEEWLPVALLIVRGLGFNQLADELEEKLDKRVRSWLH
ncbi:hypothetical protein Dsin_031912 [Dipteronia sinensis]|uniref:Uncharacterized protein n=1 Tax=Dipteronia sinensis TaxID=43782 RepID=A0AAD9ZLX2_9ROSI|nr:hypothetical protein Dsin_031912 [Dipteronia sinensis]